MGRLERPARPPGSPLPPPSQVPVVARHLSPPGPPLSVLRLGRPLPARFPLADLFRLRSCVHTPRGLCRRCPCHCLSLSLCFLVCLSLAPLPKLRSWTLTPPPRQALTAPLPLPRPPGLPAPAGAEQGGAGGGRTSVASSQSHQLSSRGCPCLGSPGPSLCPPRPGTRNPGHAPLRPTQPEPGPPEPLSREQRRQGAEV